MQYNWTVMIIGLKRIGPLSIYKTHYEFIYYNVKQINPTPFQLPMLLTTHK